MNKFMPFVLLFAAVFAAFGILVLLMRTDALPESVRSLDWRKAARTVIDEAVSDEAV